MQRERPDAGRAARPAGRRAHLRLVSRPPLRVVDVALFYGTRSGGIRTYLDAKAAYAARTGAFEHHLVIPGPRERHVACRHELPAVTAGPANGYRVPRGAGRLTATLRELRPDVVLVHDPFWAPLSVAEVASTVDAAMVAVHHAGVDFNAAALPGPDRLWRGSLRASFRRAYAAADGIMSAVDTFADSGRAPTMQLRLGVEPAFRPQTRAPRGDHVLYVGRLSREKGVDLLLDAAARSSDPWPLQLVGNGPAEGALAARARRLGIEQRVSFRPYVRDHARLARLYARARVMCMPGRLEAFGLVALEAAASGARTVTAATAPSARAIGPELVDTFRAQDAGDLLAAIERSRERVPDLEAARALADRSDWGAVFEAELSELEALAR